MQKIRVALATCSCLVCGLQAATSPNMGKKTDEVVIEALGADSSPQLGVNLNTHEASLTTGLVRLADYLRTGVDTDYGHKQVVWNSDGTYNIRRLNGDQTESFAANAQRIVDLLTMNVGVSDGNLNPDDSQRILSELCQILSNSSGEENYQAVLLDSMVRVSGQSATLGQPINLPTEAIQSTPPMAMPQQQPAVETPVAPSSTETANLTQRNEELTNENADLKSQVEAQQAEIEQLKAELAMLKQENK